MRHDDDMSDPDVAVEAAYWLFDAWRAGRNRAPGLGPMEERDAFKAAVRERLFPLIPDTRGPIGGGSIIAVECDDLAAVSLVTDGARWGVRMDDGDEVRWLATEDEARRSFAEHIAADRDLDHKCDASGPRFTDKCGVCAEPTPNRNHQPVGHGLPHEPTCDRCLADLAKGE